jgi:hypothetical protein
MFARMTHLRRPGARVALVLVTLAAMAAALACREVGRGDLHVANDLSGIGRDNTIFRAYLSDPGEPWPPAGQLNLFVRGDDIGKPPSFGFNGYLYLVRTSMACPQSEGAPEVFHLPDVTITGIVTVVNGTVNQFVTMPDTPANRSGTWALIAIDETPDTSGGHLISRCGTVTWQP